MIVAIPSKGRAGAVKSQSVIPSAKVYVPESEWEDYVRLGGMNVEPVPAEIRGITKTRNWILDHVNDPRVVFIDDDVKQQGWIRLDTYTARHVSLGEDAWLAEWERLFDVTEGMGLRIFGVATDGAPRSVYPWRPFIWHTYVTASCMGIVNDGRTRFDESFAVKEDYELCLRCLVEDGAVVGARYLYWVNDHWTGAGGCRDYRTQAMEEEATSRLMRMYGRYIRRVTRGGSKFSIELDF